jgi:peptidoglycan/xylan/chitin deacetylase (PgdA/CDA1 family)
MEFSAWARLLAAARRLSSDARSHASPGALASLAAAVLLVLLVSGATTRGAARPLSLGGAGLIAALPEGALAPAGPTGPVATGQGSYRIVGCRSQGLQAYRHGPARREVAIGFDDGPWRDTLAFVGMLERSHAPATFFMIGRQLRGAYRATLLRELRDGDALGDHTFTHPNLTQSGGVRGQLQETLAAIRAFSGYTPCVFRPPYGATDASVQRTARSLGLATVLWNVDPSDYTQPGSGAIERRVLAAVQPGSIVISHDGGGPRGQTLAAYPSIIAALRRRGYGIVTIPELLGFRPVYVPCVRLCDGIGLARGQLPRDAIVERAP